MRQKRLRIRIGAWGGGGGYCGILTMGATREDIPTLYDTLYRKPWSREVQELDVARADSSLFGPLE